MHKPRRPPGPWLYAGLWILMMALRQDGSFVDEPRLLFGVMPVALAYEAGFSVVAALVMGWLVRRAWPAELEALEADDEEPARGR
jgi:hypothetical protein